MNILDRLIVRRYNALLRPKPDLVPEFIDNEGRTWYTFPNGEMPVARVAKIKTYYDILSRGLSGAVIDEAFEAANTCLAHGKIAEAGRVLCDLKELKDNIVNLDAFVNIIAASYVIDGEEAAAIHDHTHRIKTDYLMSEVEGGRFFFQTTVWRRLAEQFSLSTMDADELLTAYIQQLKRLRKRWSVLTGEQSLEKLAGTS